MRLPIYLDYASSTPVDPGVVEKMHECLISPQYFSNSGARSHKYGWLAEQLIEEARQDVAEVIHCDPREVIWTSGATESNNLAIKGIAPAYQKKRKHIITSKIEHKSVLEPCHYLEKLGFKVTYLTPNKQGVITLDQVQKAVDEDTLFVSLMQVNNELGSINDVVEIGKFLKQQKAHILALILSSLLRMKLSLTRSLLFLS